MRRSIQLAVMAGWLVAMAWFVRYEAFPEYFVHRLPGYRAIFKDVPVLLDSWMLIKFKGEPIGYSQTQVDTSDENTDEYFLLNNRTHLDLRVMGRRQRMMVTMQAGLDPVYRLQSFQFSLSSGVYNARVTGRREHGDSFGVEIRTDAGRQHLSIRIPDDVILYSPMTDAALGSLKPGQQQRITTLDPASLSTVSMLVTALRTENLTVAGVDTPATVLSIDYAGMELLSWVEAGGRVLRQETPLGWTLEACAPSEALALDTGTADLDLLSELAVPVQGTIANPRMAREVTVAVSGLSLPPSVLASRRQDVLDSVDHRVRLRLRAAQFAETGLVAADPREDDAAYLAATAFIQSDDPAIRRQARRIVDGHSGPREQAVALAEWVHRNVRKNPAVSLPSAVDVLKRLEGDCNEHTYLFVALARSIGLPAKVKVGLVYLDGAFYYHAWPAVRVDDWVEMDPTFGQTLVDATHLALLEGELGEQLRLVGMVGRLRAEILEVR